MTTKRYFEKRWGEEFYIFDSNIISESDFEEKLEYQDYKAFEDSMMGDEVVNRLNELYEENIQLENKLKFLNELNKPYGDIIEENRRLKAFIKRLSNDCGEIILMNGIGYKVDKILM